MSDARLRHPLAFSATTPLAPVLATFSILAMVPMLVLPAARADNSRCNNSVVANVYTIQQQAGCTNNLTSNAQLRLAPHWHTRDVFSNRDLDGESGSDGSTPQDRAIAAGHRGVVDETVAINPAIAISGVELMNQWYYNPAYMTIMQNCANIEIGVRSENSLDRTVVVAVYGRSGRATR
jgi:hypothetical protein